MSTVPGGADVISPNSDLQSGQRRLPDIGNAQHRLFAIVTNLALNRYYWSVQTIDSGLSASAFSTEASFAIGEPSIRRIQRTPDGRTELDGVGLPHCSYAVQVSTDFENWQTITNVMAGNDGSLRFLETEPSSEISKYYRFVSP